MPAPKPTALKLVDAEIGRPSRQKINKFEPMPITGDLTDCPDWFTDEQRSEWDYAIDNIPKGLLKKIDKHLLVSWAIACDMHRQACIAVQKSGMIVKSPDKGVPMQNPYLAIINRQSVVMTKCASEMGFSPISRTKISLNAAPNDENPFLKNGRKK